MHCSYTKLEQTLKGRERSVFALDYSKQTRQRNCSVRLSARVNCAPYLDCFKDGDDVSAREIVLVLGCEPQTLRSNVSKLHETEQTLVVALSRDM